MINIKKIVNTRVNHLVNSNKDFEAIYNGMFLNPEYIFAETNDGHNITKYTFKQVDERINDIAYSLNKNYPLLKDQYICIAEDNSIEWIYIFFGILKSGFCSIRMIWKNSTSLVENFSVFRGVTTSRS